MTEIVKCMRCGNKFDPDEQYVSILILPFGFSHLCEKCIIERECPNQKQKKMEAFS